MNADGASLVCARRAPLALLTESGADDVNDRLAGIDVGDELRLALRGVGALAEQHNLRLHAQPAHAGQHAHATGHMGCARKGREWVAMARRDSGAVVAGFLAVKSAVASSPNLWCMVHGEDVKTTPPLRRPPPFPPTPSRRSFVA